MQTDGFTKNKTNNLLAHSKFVFNILKVIHSVISVSKINTIAIVLSANIVVHNLICSKQSFSQPLT